MNFLRILPHRWLAGDIRLGLAVGICGLGLCLQVVRADQSVAPGGAGVADVRIGADGILRGRVLDLSADLRPGVAGQTWQVKLLRGRQVVVVLPTGRRGEFAVRGLAGGVYRAVVEGPGGSADRFFRVWTCSAAPPRALSEMVVPLQSPIVRGQHFTPLPVASFPEGLVLAEIAVGAVAAPITYYRARTKNKPDVHATSTTTTGSGAEVAASLAEEIVAEAMAAPAVFETAESDEKIPRSP